MFLIQIREGLHDCMTPILLKTFYIVLKKRCRFTNWYVFFGAASDVVLASL